MEIKEFLVAESEETEAAREHESHELPAHVTVTRRGHGSAPRLLTIRLSEEQYARVAEVAAARDLPVSTTARALLMEAVQGSGVERAFAQALRETLRPELLRSV